MRVVLRPLAAEDAEELLRILRTPQVARWWDAPDPGFPLTDDPDSTRLTIEVDGTIAGLVQFSEEREPKYRHASIDLFLDPAVHGRGIGTEVVRRVARLLIDERGHHRVTIDPAAANAAAIRAYEKAGFRPVGLMRRYERDVGGGAWHDGLLMELVAEDPGVEALDHVGIAVSDLERSERFYTDVLGLERVSGWGEHPVILVRGGSGVALFRADGAGAGTPPIRVLHVAFRLADADAAARRLSERGIAFEREEHHGIARSLYLADPDGHQIELIAYEPPI